MGAETTTALLTVKNSASNQIAFMDASCRADSALSVDAGAELSVSLATGAHKFWVVPDGCTKEEGCYPCGMDCLGCFYIASNVGANGGMVTTTPSRFTMACPAQGSLQWMCLGRTLIST